MNKFMTQDEIKAYCAATMSELSEYFKQLEAISEQFYKDADVMSFPQYQPIENKLVGMYSFINTKCKEFEAMEKTYEAHRFNDLRVAAEIASVKFVADVAKHDATEYAKDLRVTYAKLQGCVEDIEQLLTTCRGHKFSAKKGHNYEG